MPLYKTRFWGILERALSSPQGEDIPLSVFSDDYQTMLQLLRKTRKSQGFTQQQVAQTLGITQSIIGKIERGERRIDVIELRELCRAINVPLILFIHQLESSLAQKNSG